MKLKDLIGKETEKMKEPRRQVRDFPDAQLAAFFDMRGFIVRAKKGGGIGRFIFEVSGFDLDKVVEDFYGNAKVPILDFLSSYRKIKSILYNLKGR